jgi:splicing factor 3A subunit 3
MACLGIPNTKHFQDVTQIEDAQQLWRNMQQQEKLKEWRPDEDEEYEDDEGNVYNRKTFEDLKRQGLIK